jgi:hypothetical protein
MTCCKNCLTKTQSDVVILHRKNGQLQGVIRERDEELASARILSSGLLKTIDDKAIEIRNLRALNEDLLWVLAELRKKSGGQ